MAYLVVDEPRAAPVPLVVAVPHAGTRVPAEVASTLAVSRRMIRMLEDPWVDELVAEAAEVGAWRLVTRWARVVADVNRAPDEFCGLGGEAGFRSSAKARIGLGVVPTAVAGLPLYRRPLGRDEIDRRLAMAHAPYHRRLRDLLREVQGAFGEVVLLDWHSMPEAALGLGQPTADVVIGDNFARSARTSTVEALESAFVRQGLRTVRNRPYAGGHVTQTYGRPAEGCEVVQIELRRGLYMDERRFIRGAGFAAVSRALRAVLEDVSGHLAGRRRVPWPLAGE